MKSGTIVLTPELLLKVGEALEKSAEQIGMTIQEYSIVAKVVIDVWHEQAGMKVRESKQAADI